MIIASGRQPGILARILPGEQVGTLFVAQGQTIASLQTLDRIHRPAARPSGARRRRRRAVEKQGRSLLAIGIVEAVGNFKKGDVVSLRDAAGDEFARGLINYPAEEVQRIKGLKTEAIATALGHCPYQEVIHRDNIAVTTVGA